MAVDVGQGAAVIGVRTADREIAALPIGEAMVGVPCIRGRTADRQVVALPYDTIRVAGQIGVKVRTADRVIAGLSLPTAIATCELRPLGLSPGYTYRIMPTPLQWDGGTGAVEPGVTPFQAALALDSIEWAGDYGQPLDPLHARWVEGWCGVPYQDAYGKPSPGLSLNDHLMREHLITGMVGGGGLAGSLYQFFAPLPHHTIGGQIAAGLSASPTDGYWLHGEPVPLILSWRLVKGPGPLHRRDGHAPCLFEGQDEFVPELPTVRSMGQVFINLKAGLERDGDLIRLRLRAGAVLLIGSQWEFGWSVPLTITGPNSGISCPGTFGPAVGTCFTLPPTSGDLGSMDPVCYCICTGAHWLHCLSMDLGVNNYAISLQQPADHTDYLAACTETHPEYMGELLCEGQRERVIERQWNFGDDYTLANLEAAFPEIAGRTTAEWVADEFNAFAGAESIDIENAVDPGATEWYLEAPHAHAKVAAKVSLSGVNSAIPSSIDGSSPVEIVECAPTIRKACIVRADGYEEWLRREHYFLLTNEDTECAGNPGGDWWRLWNVLKNELLVPIDQLGDGGVAAAYLYMCRMRRSWLVMQGILNGADWPAVTTIEDIPLRDDLYPNGLDPTTGEYVFGLPGAIYDAMCDPAPILCESLLGWFDDDGDCVLPPVPWFLNSDWSLLWFGDTHVLPPSWPAFDTDHTYCKHDSSCWREIGRGGRIPILWEPQLVGPGDTPWHGVPDPTGGDYYCGWLNDDDIFHTEDNWPRLHIQGRPWLNLRLKITNGVLQVRAYYEVQLVREDTWWFNWEQLPAPEVPIGQMGMAPVTTHMGTLEVGRGGQFDFPAWVPDAACEPCNPQGELPQVFKTAATSVPKLLCGCGPDRDELVFDIAGSGNVLRVFV